MEVVGPDAPLAHVPLVQVGNLRGEVRGAVPVRVGIGRQRVTERVRGGNVGDVGGGGRRRLAVHFHVLPQRARVRVGFVTAAHLTVVRLVTRVNVRVLLPVAAVGEFSVTAVELALERFFTWKKETNPISVTRAGSHQFYTAQNSRTETPHSHLFPLTPLGERVSPPPLYTTSNQHSLVQSFFTCEHMLRAFRPFGYMNGDTQERSRVCVVQDNDYTQPWKTYIFKKKMHTPTVWSVSHPH